LLYGSSPGVNDEAKKMTLVEADSVARIRASALTEIRKNGILGLRLADVAAGADVSVALVYKYFGDRDGLLAGVLGDVIVQQFEEELVGIEKLLESLANGVNFDDVLRLMPKPDDKWRKERRWLRLEAKAAGREIPALAERIGRAMAEVEDATTELIKKARAKSGNKSTVPARTISWAIIAFSDGFTNSDIMPNRLDDENYLPFLTDMLKRYVF
jgi:AcrR family transcriptional regulator